MPSRHGGSWSSVGDYSLDKREGMVSIPSWSYTPRSPLGGFSQAGDSIVRWYSNAVSISILVFVATSISAQDKPAASIDGKKLIGKWEGEPVVLKTKDGKTQLEFCGDGVLKVKVTLGESVSLSNEGKYTLDGNKLTIITKLPDGKEDRSVATITKLTDTELEWRNHDEKLEAFKRVKEEKK
jgi:uncharacterized protein (TIGR03066 family)